MKRNNWILFVALILLVVGGIFTYLYMNKPELKYPKLNLKYDYNTLHLYHAEQIQALLPDCKVDSVNYQDNLYECTEANLIFYNNLKDKKYIAKVIKILDLMTQPSRVGDANNDGLKDIMYYKDGSAGMYTPGYITQLLSDTIMAVESNKLTEYYSNIAKYKPILNDYIEYGLRRFHPYEKGTKQLGYFSSSVTATNAVPYNQAGAFSTAMLRYGNYKNNETYKNVARRYLNRFLDLNKVKTYETTNYLSMTYYLHDEAVTGELVTTNTWTGYTDTKHLNLEFEFIMACYENNYLSSEELRLITNTLKVMEVKGKVNGRETPLFNEVTSPPRKMYTDETTKNIFHQTGQIYNMIRVATIEPNLVYDFEEVMRNSELDGALAGKYYSQFYRCANLPNTLVNGQTGTGYYTTPFCSSDSNSYQVESSSILLGIANLGRYDGNVNTIFNLNYLAIGLIFIVLSLILLYAWWNI